MLRQPLAGILVAAALAGFPGASQATSGNACIAAAADMELAAKTSFQTALRDLVVRENPGFESLASLNMELQIALAQSRRARLVHLLHTDPARLTTNSGMSQLSNFDWTKADAASLVRTDDRQRALAARIASLIMRNNGHRQWPELRRYFAETLATLTEFKAIMAQMRQDRGSAARHLQTCRSN